VGYVPNTPEAVVAFLATASIGATWASCASDFGARAVIDRFAQIEPVVLFVAGGYAYGAKNTGHIVNRLQAALWREAYHLVDIGAVSVADLDLAIANGPGLRWALAGPFATQHLSGGGQGIGHILEHLGPPMVQWWDDLGHPQLSDELIAKIVAGVDAELADRDETDLLRRRDAALVELLHLKDRADVD